MTIDFTTVNYLLSGTPKQKEAYRIIDEIKILELLKNYKPILVGTIPIDIDIPASDLDIICEVHNFDYFEELILLSFGNMEAFRCKKSKVNGAARFVANFKYRNWPVEIFAQAIPATDQNGYKHMMIEYRILKILGETGNILIRDLKKKGLKTEPAFADLLKLSGDAYQLLLEMYDWEEDKLANFLVENRRGRNDE